jgi:hypothetical protein
MRETLFNVLNGLIYDRRKALDHLRANARQLAFIRHGHCTPQTKIEETSHSTMFRCAFDPSKAPAQHSGYARTYDLAMI